MPDIALLCALEVELKPILRELRLTADPHSQTDYVGNVACCDVVAAVCGVGAERAQRGMAYMASKKPKLVILAGFAGGLDPFFRTGYLFTAQQVIDETGQAIELIGDVPRVLEQRSDSHATLLSVHEPVLNTFAKDALHEQHRAGAVDMETFAAAAYAAEYGVPLSVVRAISDDAESDVPPWAMSLIGEDGLVRTARAAACVLLMPWRIGALRRMGKNSAIAGKALAACIAGRIAAWAQMQAEAV